MRCTFIGCIMILAAQPRGDCFPPLNPCAHWAAISSVILHDLKLTAGAAAPLERFGNLLPNRPQTPDCFVHSVRLRGEAARAPDNQSGAFPSHAFTALTALRGCRRVCCWQSTSTVFSTFYTSSYWLFSPIIAACHSGSSAGKLIIVSLKKTFSALQR